MYGNVKTYTSGGPMKTSWSCPSFKDKLNKSDLNSCYCEPSGFIL